MGASYMYMNALPCSRARRLTTEREIISASSVGVYLFSSLCSDVLVVLSCRCDVVSVFESLTFPLVEFLVWTVICVGFSLIC